ncbi:MAG: double-strand break repair protein AddB, partial [Pseudomonadota bacterium]
MSLFAPQAGPRLYRMPPGVDFAAGFSAGLAARMDGIEQTVRPGIEVRLNTTRSVRAVEAGLARAAPGLLPRLTTVDAPAHPLKVIPTLRRRLILGRIVAAYLDAQPGLAPKAAAFDYADSLAALLDEMGEAGVTGDAFASLAPADHAEHWQRGQAMLDLVARAWPQHLAEAEGDALDPGAALRRAVLRETADWAAAPPKTPLIIAGSTGSRAPTHLMLKAVAFLPQGAVVLPGVDPHLDAEDLAQIAQSAPDHPQSAIARLLVALDMAPADIPIWHGAPPLEARSRLISLSLRPAPVTHIWRDAIPQLQTEVGVALADVTLLAAPSARAEADAIALALRHAIEQGETAALVTPDRDLARRVTAALGRWGLVPDDTAGRPLSLAPPGILLRLIAQGLGPPMSPVGVLEILGHPLVASGDQEARARHRDGVIALEQRILPDLPGPLDWDAVASHRAMTDPDWLAWVRETLAPLEASPRSLSAWLSLHLDCAQRLAAGYGSDGEGGLWDKQ